MGLGQVLVLNRAQVDAVLTAFVVRPAEVGAGLAGVDLLPGVPADLAQEQVAVGVERHAERVADAVLEHLGLVGVGVALHEEGVVGQAVAGQRVDAQNLAGQVAQVLDAHATRVGEVERGAVTHRDVEGAVRAERQAAAGVGQAVAGDVVLDVGAVGPDAGGRLLEVLGAVDHAAAADVGQRLAGAAEQDHRAVRVDAEVAVGSGVHGVAHEVHVAVAGAVGARVAAGWVSGDAGWVHGVVSI